MPIAFGRFPFLHSSFIIFVSIDTMRSKNSSPFSWFRAENSFSVAPTSRMSPHSMADPRAIPKQRDLSAVARFPTPSAMFWGIETDARFNSSVKKKYPLGSLPISGAAKVMN
jgi:hypothetical protein